MLFALLFHFVISVIQLLNNGVFTVYNSTRFVIFIIGLERLFM